MKHTYVLRKFPYSLQLEIAKVKLAYLHEDLADFQAWNGQRFNEQYLADFENTLKAARDFLDDETIVDQGTAHTREMDDLMKSCRRVYKKLRYYVTDAFSDNLSIQNQFGFNDYPKARVSRARMVMFMSKIYRVAQNNKEPLMQEGYTQVDIDRLGQLRDQLEVANVKRGTFKERRRDATTHRQELFQAIGQYVWQVCQAGQLIFPADHSRHNRYLMPRRPGNAGSPDGIWLEAKTKTVALNGGLPPERRLSVANLGEVPLSLYGGDNEDGTAPEELLQLDPGENIQLSAGELNGGEGFRSLIVWNPNDRPARYVAKYEEEV